MIILNSNCEFIQVNSALLTDALLNPSSYTGVSIKGTINCCGVDYPQALTLANGDYAKYKIENNILYIKPQLFGFDKLKDGVYSFQLTLISAEPVETVVESNCAFIDCTLKCGLSNKLYKIDDKDKAEVNEATTFAMLHYTLTHTSNCGCNCEELCEIYKQLVKYVDDTDYLTSQLSDCGCY